MSRSKREFRPGPSFTATAQRDRRRRYSCTLVAGRVRLLTQRRPYTLERLPRAPARAGPRHVPVPRHVRKNARKQVQTTRAAAAGPVLTEVEQTPAGRARDGNVSYGSSGAGSGAEAGPATMKAL